MLREGGIPYAVRIFYKLGAAPQCWVVDPPILSYPGCAVPHLYRDCSLCLNLPAEWDPKQLIASTIVPWISRWLFHYEVWRATNGEWLGGGLHPTARRHRTK